MAMLAWLQAIQTFIYLSVTHLGLEVQAKGRVFSKETIMPKSTVLLFWLNNSSGLLDAKELYKKT